MEIIILESVSYTRRSVQIIWYKRKESCFSIFTFKYKWIYVCSRLDIVVSSVECIILVWNHLNSRSKLYVDIANKLVVKYVTFHSVLKEYTVVYWINSKKSLRILHDVLFYIWSNTREDGRI